MIGLAASVAFAGSVILAAIRLLTRRDNIHRRSYIFITPTFFHYLFIHGVSAVAPFPIYWFWPNDWSHLFTASPWLIAVLSPFVANHMLKLKGFDFPDATGPLSRFHDDVQTDFGQRMIDEQFAAMRRFIEPYANGVARAEAYALALRNTPWQFPDRQLKAYRNAIAAAVTVEEIMELYIRHIGMNSFVFVFKKKEDHELAQLLLFLNSTTPSRPCDPTISKQRRVSVN